MATPIIAKYPSEALNIGVDFSARLNGNTISSNGVSVLSGDVSIGAAVTSGNVVYTRVTAGTIGVNSLISYSATLSDGEILYGMVRISPMAEDF